MKRLVAFAVLVSVVTACAGALERGGQPSRSPEIDPASAVPGLIISAILYVRRGACAPLGHEKDADNTFKDIEYLKPGEPTPSFNIAIPFYELAKPAGPFQRWCVRTVYEATVREDAAFPLSPWPHQPFSKVRIAHQDGPSDMLIIPGQTLELGDDVWGPLVGGDWDADPALYDDDKDHIPNLRELQLALRPTVPDVMEPDTVGLVHLDAVTGMRFGEDGEFSSEGPAVSVAVRAFDIDPIEATNHQYRVCMGTPGNGRFLCEKPAVAPDDVVTPELETFPAAGLTHDQAEAFCGARAMRLPSEKEWERAARVDGSDVAHPRRYPWGDDEPTRFGGTNRCNLGRFVLYEGELPFYCDDNRNAASLGPSLLFDGTPLREPLANGLYDLAGGVAEWTRERWNPDIHAWASTSTEDYVLGTGAWVARGGSFRSGQRFVRGYARAPVDDGETASRADVLRAMGVRCVSAP